MRNGRLSQKLGKFGENRACWYFNQIGAKCVEKISTPMINVKGKAIYCKSSSIDFTAAFPTPGCINPYIAVRVEVKLCDDTKLVHSRLKDHQVKWLAEWAVYGFYSFVLWVHNTEVFLIPYPNKLFKPHKSLLVEQAREIMKNSRYSI